MGWLAEPFADGGPYAEIYAGGRVAALSPRRQQRRAHRPRLEPSAPFAGRRGRHIQDKRTCRYEPLPVGTLYRIKTLSYYYKEFYVAQTQTVRDKINFVLKLVETQRIIPKKFFRIIEGSDGIYEIKVEIESNVYRIFCCMDGGAVVVLFHGFQKKTQKTPQKEIKRAEAIKKEYFKSKETE